MNRMITSSIHNPKVCMRATLVAILALILVSTGFSCSRKQSQTPVEPQTPPAQVQDAGPSSSVPDAGLPPGLPTRWATYRNEALGIEIPYPEGWYVMSNEQDRSIDVYRSEPPTLSDAPSEFWMKTTPGKIDRLLSEFPVISSRTEIRRSRFLMTRITYPYEARLRPDERMVAYLWQDGDVARAVGGLEGSTVLEYVVDHVEVSR